MTTRKLLLWAGVVCTASVLSLYCGLDGKSAIVVANVLGVLFFVTDFLVRVFLRDFERRKLGRFIGMAFGLAKGLLVERGAATNNDIPCGSAKVLHVVLRGRDREVIARQLEEQFVEAREKFGAKFARRMYRWHVFMEVCSFCADKVERLLKLLGVGGLIDLWKLIR